MNKSLDKLHLSADEYKDTEEFGISIAKRIEREWNSGHYQTRNDRFSLNRAFARGRQPMAEYLSYLNIDGKEAYVNLDMKPLAIAPKFMDIILGGFMKRGEKPRVKAMDSVTIKKKKYDITEAKFVMANKDDLMAMEEASGMELTPKNIPIFKSDEELELYFGMEYKVPEEIMFERGLNTVLEQNDWDVIKRRLIEDITEINFAVTKTYASVNGAVKIRRVVPEKFITSFSEYDDFRDMGWCGEIYEMPISELRNRFRHLTDEDIEDIVNKNKKYKQSNSSASNYRGFSSSRSYDEDYVSVLDFEFKTTKRHIYQSRTNKYGNKVVEKKAKVPERLGDNKEIIQKDLFVIYQGVYVMGCDKMLQWGLVKNMIKKDNPAEIAEAHFNYSVIMPKNHSMESISLPERMTSSIKAMTIAHLKLQQLIAKLRPSGLAVDVDGLQELSLGDGKNLKPLELQAIYDQTGTFYYRGLAEDGETRRGLPITELPNTGGVPQINALIQIFNSYLSRLRDEIGINEYREGQSVNPKMGLGVMQNQIAASNNATDFIYDAYLTLFNNTMKKAAILLYDSVTYGGKAYQSQFGETAIKGREFDIQIEMLPDDSHRQFLEAMIQTALSAQQIEFEDAFKIRHIDNVKLGEYYLAKARRRRLEEAQAQAQQNSQMNAQIQQQSAQQAMELEAQKMQLEAQSKSAVVTTELELKKQLSEQEFVQEMMKESFIKGKELQGMALEYVNNYFQRKNAEAQAQAQAEQAQAAQQQQAQIIEQMRAEGYSDEDIAQALEQGGVGM